MLEKATRARGFSRHIGSRTLPGIDSDISDSKLTSEPKAENMLRAVTPQGLLSPIRSTASLNRVV